jgi:hypothetical protein
LTTLRAKAGGGIFNSNLAPNAPSIIGTDKFPVQAGIDAVVAQ